MNFPLFKSLAYEIFWLKFGFSEKATKFEKIFVVLLTRVLCSVRATAYLSKRRQRFFKTNVVKSYYTDFNSFITVVKELPPKNCSIQGIILKIRSSKGIGQKLSLAKFFLNFLKYRSSEICIKQGPPVLRYWWMPLKTAEHALVNATRTNICLLVLSLRWQLWCQN